MSQAHHQNLSLLFEDQVGEKKNLSHWLEGRIEHFYLLVCVCLAVWKRVQEGRKARFQAVFTVSCLQAYRAVGCESWASIALFPPHYSRFIILSSGIFSHVKENREMQVVACVAKRWITLWAGIVICTLPTFRPDDCLSSATTSSLFQLPVRVLTSCHSTASKPGRPPSV